MESWLELWDGTPGQSNLLPGYGWIFGVGDGTANVGLGILNTSTAFQQVDYKQILHTLAGAHARRSGASATRTWSGRIGSAALPMGFNRKPHYTRGMLLVGDSGGMVNPFNGEGIDYALEAGAPGRRQRSSRRWPVPDGPARERVLEGYAAALDAAYGGYFTLGRVFAKMIGNPTFMKQATKYGLPRHGLDAFHAQADGQPDRPPRRRRLGPHHQRAQQDRARRLTCTTRTTRTTSTAAAHDTKGGPDTWSSTPR